VLLDLAQYLIWQLVHAQHRRTRSCLGSACVRSRMMPIVSSGAPPRLLTPLNVRAAARGRTGASVLRGAPSEQARPRAALEKRERRPNRGKRAMATIADSSGG
jgi:hypothetical protein